MPIIRGWFDENRVYPWEEWDKAYYYNDKQGPKYKAYPLIELLPRVRPDETDLYDTVGPVWITDIDPYSNIGKVNARTEGAYIIDLPETFGCYIDSLEYDHRKKMRYSLRRNEDLSSKIDQKEDIDVLWDDYIIKIQEFSMQDEGELYTPERINLRKEFVKSSNTLTLSIYLKNDLIAVNVSKIENDTIYDLACMRRPDSEILARGVGIYASLLNIEHAIEKKYKFYDMLTDNFGYKTKFGAKEVKMRHFLKCDKKFAEIYDIDLNDVSILI